MNAISPSYLLARNVLGRSPEIPISEEKYTQTLRARDGLLLCIDLEERLFIVLESFYQFEVALFGIGLKWTIHEDWRWKSIRDSVLELNVPLLNLLNAIYMYQEHVEQLTRSGCLERQEQEELRSGLKTMCRSSHLHAARQLRNYCQHQGLGFEGIGVTNDRYTVQRLVPRGRTQERLFTSAVLAVNTTELAQTDRKDRRRFAEELQRQGVRQWDPTPDLRGAVDSITAFQCLVRESLAADLAIWKNTLSTLLDEAGRQFSQIVGLGVVKKFGRGDYRDWVPVFSHLLNRVDELRDRNGRGSTALIDSIVTTIQPT